MIRITVQQCCTRSKIYKPLPGKKTARSHLSNHFACLPFNRIALSSFEYLLCG
ncbi:hypothetical protein [Nostoc sp. NZL]|uniref:hypothetical protein n=1 Tax=Nostoc sp. NZL TaxID=2650612 RepID=UPI0018C6E825|nr:hypothetical protein [Nostoc sp. NZL]